MEDKAKHIASLESQILQQQAQIQDLTAKLSLALSQLSKQAIPKDSRNSSLPPSQDKVSKKRTQSLRQKSSKKSGGQSGHPGSNLKMVATPATVVALRPCFCQRCGAAFSDAQLHYQKSRQVVDIPLPTPEVTEFQQYSGTCGCGHVQSGEFPSGVKAHIQYGQHVEAFVGYLSVAHYIPYGRMVTILKDLFGIEMSEGTVANILQRLKEKGLPYYEQIRQYIASDTHVVGADESACRVNGDNHWAWVWQTPALCYLTIAPNRGKATVDSHFPEGFPQAVLTSDRWASHLNTTAQAHQICLAHLLRALNYLEAAEKHSFSIELQALFRTAIDEKKQHLVFAQTATIAQKLEQQLDTLLQQTIPKETYPETAKLQKSLIKLRQAVFPFLYHKEVPPDNNASERAIRNIKVKMKVSGQFKSGQEGFAVIRSIIDTVKKKQQSIWEVLVDLANVNNSYAFC